MTQQPTFKQGDFVWATYYSGFNSNTKFLRRVDSVSAYYLVDSYGCKTTLSTNEIKTTDMNNPEDCKEIEKFCSEERQRKQQKVDELTAELELAKAALAQN